MLFRTTKNRSVNRLRQMGFSTRRLRGFEPLENRTLLDAGGFGPNYTVDDDAAQHQNADFVTAAGIQLALNAAAADPGKNIIKVYPGLYSPVIVSPGNTGDQLIAVGHGAGVSNPANGNTDAPLVVPTDPTEDAIIFGAPPASVIGAVNINASDFRFSGFVVEGNTDGPGIYTSPTTSDVLIDNNLVQNNVFGIYFNSSGAEESIVRNNYLNNNNVPGSASGNGIYSDQGLRNATIESNLITNHTNAGIILIGFGAPPNSDITITNNALIEDASITLLQIDNSEVTHNLSVNSKGSGIVVTDAQNLLIAYNDLQNGAFNGISLTTVGVGESANVRIEHNHIFGFGDNGVRLSFSQNNIVSYNEIENNRGSGILVEETSSANLLAHNQVFENGSPLGDATDGIRILLGSVGNVIEYNRMFDNITHDAHDDNPLGVNIWRHNQCETENQPGLCDDHGHA